jgi:hypothetical protein
VVVVSGTVVVASGIVVSGIVVAGELDVVVGTSP